VLAPAFEQSHELFRAEKFCSSSVRFVRTRTRHRPPLEDLSTRTPFNNGMSETLKWPRTAPCCCKCERTVGSLSVQCCSNKLDRRETCQQDNSPISSTWQPGSEPIPCMSLIACRIPFRHQKGLRRPLSLQVSRVMQTRRLASKIFEIMPALSCAIELPLAFLRCYCDGHDYGTTPIGKDRTTRNLMGEVLRLVVLGTSTRAAIEENTPM
jgi:hypothetical protein